MNKIKPNNLSQLQARIKNTLALHNPMNVLLARFRLKTEASLPSLLIASLLFVILWCCFGVLANNHGGDRNGSSQGEIPGRLQKEITGT